MLAFIFLCCLVTTKAVVVQNVCEGGLHFDGKYYEQETIKKDLDKPYQMVVDDNNTLYFSYSVGSNEKDNFKIASINLNNKEFTEIVDIEDGFAATVDREKGIVYLGGSDGIYILDTKGKSALHNKAEGKNIWILFFKDHLYFVDYPEQKLYVYENEEPKLVPEFAETTITQFAVDNNGERFFANDTGLYGLEKNSSLDKAKLYDSKVAIRGIALNKDGKAYFCGENGIFILDKENKIEYVALINNAFGLAFDKDDNVIYANSNKITKLIPSSKNCTVFKN